jgi:putative phosphotransacetylase
MKVHFNQPTVIIPAAGTTTKENGNANLSTNNTSAIPKPSFGWTGCDKSITVLASAKHIHLTQEHLEILFGKGFKLTPLKALYGLPMDLAKGFIFSSTSTLQIIGTKPGRSLQARILGPCRDYSQVELAYTDALAIGVDAPVRLSGNLQDTGSCTLLGPEGKLFLNGNGHGVIRAQRHFHCFDIHCHWLQVKHEDTLCLKVISPHCNVILENLSVKHELVNLSIEDKTNLLKIIDKSKMLQGIECHLDTDEANACMLHEAIGYEILRKESNGSYKVLATQKLK